MILQLAFQFILLSLPNPVLNALAQAPLPLARPGCASSCGNVDIPFPFGIGAGCYIDQWFAIDCNSSKPFLTSINLDVLDISLQNATMRVNHPVFYSCQKGPASIHVNLAESPFVFSQTSNRYTGVGCNNFALLSSVDSVIGGCLSICDENSNRIGENSCNGIKCCQTTIPLSLNIFNASIRSINDKDEPVSQQQQQQECKYAFLVEQQWFQSNLKNPQDVQSMTHVPVVLDWGIQDLYFNLFAMNKSTAYKLTSNCSILANDASLIFSTSVFPIVRCNCLSGYEGNPYILQGCRDIDECEIDSSICRSDTLCRNLNGTYECYIHKPTPTAASVTTQKSKINIVIIGIGTGLGSLLLLIGVWWLLIIIKNRQDIKQKEKFFKRNGGLLLQQQLTSFDGNADKSKLFSSKELDKATDHFNVNRILGQGGQGTVYKGMLTDGKIVAVKKSKVVDEGKLEEFINEVAILSQINHRNVVKLLGCCLETEVPLLVYEFVPNGTLSQYLHDDPDEEVPVTWDMRLRIATESAGALYYLHSAASIPIYHRDIKSANILLDDKYRAKVADFGTSKSVAIDQTHVTTRVQGTFGYLDPEFFQSSQFTDKSDVYSFGVVLVELLTGQKAISSTRSSEEGRGLASYFILSMEQNRMYDIIDTPVKKQANKDDIMAIANLAKRCLNLNGKKRPTMKEVAMELERVRGSSVNQNFQEVGQYLRTESIQPWCSFSSTCSTSDYTASSANIEIQPLFTI